MVFLNGKVSNLNIIFVFPSVLCCDFVHEIWINVENWEYSGLLGLIIWLLSWSIFCWTIFSKLFGFSLCAKFWMVLNPAVFQCLGISRHAMSYAKKDCDLSWSARYHYFGVNFNLIFQEISLVLSEIIFILSKYSVLWGEVKFYSAFKHVCVADALTSVSFPS